MKPFLAVVLAGIIAIITTAWIKKDVSSSPVPVHPLAPVFEQYKTTDKFEIPDGHGATIEEKQKWSLLRDVITCESASRWVIVEVPGIGWDTGPCMINTYYHIVPAARQGLDLMVPAENIRYCLYLFEQYYSAFQTGAWTPWEASRPCWENRQKIRIAQNRK